jgi:hypothetical protein
LFTFGDARFFGSAVPILAPGLPRTPPVVPGAPGARGKVVVLGSGMDRTRPALQRALLDYLERMAGAAGREIVVSTGTHHNKYTKSGNISDHWSGNAADLGMIANHGTNDGPVGDLLATVCLTTGGVDPATAVSRAQSGGLYSIRPPGLRVQCIWKTNEGGNHHDHVHVGVVSR